MIGLEIALLCLVCIEIIHIEYVRHRRAPGNDLSIERERIYRFNLSVFLSHASLER